MAGETGHRKGNASGRRNKPVQIFFLKKFFFSSLILIPNLLFAQVSFDVEHYSIQLDISNIGSQTIQGCCTVNLKSETNNLQQIQLSLLALTVDSIFVNQTAATYTYNDTTLNIQLPSPLHQGDSAGITICYHGQPVMDASGWGGFYFSGNYAFNLGVGFDANPHTYGRAWFPCVDNFTDRAAYDFHITTASNHKAFCNGLLVDSTLHSNGTITWDWHLNQTIPTYLASVAVSAYTSIDDKYASITGDSLPVMLAAQPADTAKLRASFIHLPDALAGFEDCFGAYRFDRIGFVLVPFSSGAMEHATNVAFMRAAVTGGLEYESLMAHEFSHHWFGDLVTCTTAEDMWLNEGWARYCESVFFEKVYGSERYKKSVRDNHRQVLQFTHITDDGFRAVSGVPHEYTYGSTVYDKGADVAHTLRGYLGDSLFFHCVTAYLEAFRFNHASSIDFRDFLNQCSAVDLTSFFDNWVFNAGFPHFSVDSFFVMQNGGSYDVTVFIRQRLKAAPAYYSNVPLELTFISETFDSTERTILFSGECGIYHTQLGFEPAFVAVDMNEKISDAITDKVLHISNTGSYDFEEALLTMNVTQLSSPALLRVEHNWVAPDPMKTSVPGLHLSKERFWKIDGILPAGFSASAKFSYDGTTSTSTGYLDNALITNTEDSLVILFRSDKKSDWQIHPSFTVNPLGSILNKRGEITINNISKGEYALAIWDHSRAVADSQETVSPCFALAAHEVSTAMNEMEFTLFPNPANDSFFIKFEKPLQNEAQINVIDLTGKTVDTFLLGKTSDKIEISSEKWNRGAYLICVQSVNGLTLKKLLVVD